MSSPTLEIVGTGPSRGEAPWKCYVCHEDSSSGEPKSWYAHKHSQDPNQYVHHLHVECMTRDIFSRNQAWQCGMCRMQPTKIVAHRIDVTFQQKATRFLADYGPIIAGAGAIFLLTLGLARSWKLAALAVIGYCIGSGLIYYRFSVDPVLQAALQRGREEGRREVERIRQEMARP